MKLLIISIKQIIQELLFDRNLVQHIKKAQVDKAHLYNHLTSGRITLEEYVHAVE